MIDCRQCYAFSTDMEVVLVCTGLDGRKRGESESLNNLKKAQVHYLECEKLRVNKKLKSPSRLFGMACTKPIILKDRRKRKENRR